MLERACDAGDSSGSGARRRAPLLRERRSSCRSRSPRLTSSTRSSARSSARSPSPLQRWAADGGRYPRGNEAADGADAFSHAAPAPLRLWLAGQAADRRSGRGFVPACGHDLRGIERDLKWVIEGSTSTTRVPCRPRTTVPPRDQHGEAARPGGGAGGSRAAPGRTAGVRAWAWASDSASSWFPSTSRSSRSARRRRRQRSEGNGGVQ
jgi:hypothetical protein